MSQPSNREPSLQESPLSRSIALLGEEKVRRLRNMRVFVFGLGGVGSWCAEALVRTGIGSIVIVDDDIVAPSNINRQLVATSSTLGRPKSEVLAERLLDINPLLSVLPLQRRFSDETESFFAKEMSGCQAVVDAIDSVPDKCRLIRLCQREGLFVVSSLGAALRTDPTRVACSPFHKVTGDPLARIMRTHFRRDAVAELPEHKCIYSTEVPQKSPTLGSIMPVTAAFGMALAAEVILSA